MSEVVYEVREYTIGANGRWVVDIEAKFVTIYKSDGAIKVGFDNSDPQFIEAGISVPTKGFKQVTIEDDSDTSNHVQVAFSDLPIRDGRFKMSGSVSVSGTVDIAKTSDWAVSQVSVTDAGGQLAAANETRQSILIMAEGADIWIGPSGVTTETGIKIANGSGRSYKHTSAIYAITEVGNTATVYVDEEG